MLGMKRTILLSSALCLVVMHNPAKASNLDRELHEVDKLRAGEETPFEQVEKMCKELLEKYTEWEEHGRIYFQLAHVYAQSGGRGLF